MINHGIILSFIDMYFHKIRKTQDQLEVMISVLTLEYGAKNDEQLALLIAKYFEVNVDDALASLIAYRAHKSEDYEHLSNKQLEYARL